MKGTILIMKKSFIQSKMKENPLALLYAIEDITNVNFWAEDYINTEIDFKILEITNNIKPRKTYLKEIKLKVNVTINKINYIINDWFVYNYKTKEFDLYNNYCLRWE